MFANVQQFTSNAFKNIANVHFVKESTEPTFKFQIVHYFTFTDNYCTLALTYFHMSRSQLTFEPVTNIASSVSSLRTSQIHKVKLRAHIVFYVWNKTLYHSFLSRSNPTRLFYTGTVPETSLTMKLELQTVGLHNRYKAMKKNVSGQHLLKTGSDWNTSSGLFSFLI